MQTGQVGEMGMHFLTFHSGIMISRRWKNNYWGKSYEKESYDRGSGSGVVERRVWG